MKTQHDQQRVSCPLRPLRCGPLLRTARRPPCGGSTFYQSDCSPSFLGSVLSRIVLLRTGGMAGPVSGWSIAWVALFFAAIQGCVASKSEERLLKDLFTQYDSTARPVLKDKDTVRVDLGFTLSQIIDVEEKNQLLSISANIRQKWTNELLRWDPANHSGIKELNVYPKRVWLPDIVLYNNADEDKSFGGNLDRLNTRVKLQYDGVAMWLAPVILKSKCPINVKYFPFDEQRCKLKFGSWTYDEARLNLTGEADGADLGSYLVNAEWQLEGVPDKRTVVEYICCKGRFYPDITYTIIVKRRSLFYLCNLIFPMTVIGMLTMLSFLLPAESGERVSLAITLLLAMTVFMLVVADIIPATSEVVPLVAIFFSSAMVEMVIMIIVLCYVMQLYHKQASDPPMPRWMRVFILDWLSFKLGVRYSGASNGEYFGPESDSEDVNASYPFQWKHRRDSDDSFGRERGTMVTEGNGQLWGQQQQQPPPYRSVFASKSRGAAGSRPRPVGQSQEESHRYTPRSVEARMIVKRLDVIVGKMHRDEEDSTTLSEWRIVAMTIDKILLYTFVGILAVTVLSCFLNAPGYVA